MSIFNSDLQGLVLFNLLLSLSDGIWIERRLARRILEK